MSRIDAAWVIGAVAVYYDIRFTFEIVGGKGVLKTTP